MKRNPGLDTHSVSINKHWWEWPSHRTNVPDVLQSSFTSTPHGDGLNAKGHGAGVLSTKPVETTNTFTSVASCAKPTQSVSLMGCNTLQSRCASLSVPLGGSPQSEYHSTSAATNIKLRSGCVELWECSKIPENFLMICLQFYNCHFNYLAHLQFSRLKKKKKKKSKRDESKFLFIW